MWTLCSAGAEIVAFGSFESNFFTPWGDLDLTLELPADQEASPALTKSKKVKVLKSIERALAKSGEMTYSASRNLVVEYEVSMFTEI